MQSVTAWLTNFGMEKYAEAFVAADVDLEVVGDLTDGDLEKLGVSLGDRKRILRAIEKHIPPTAPADVPVAAQDRGERRQLSVVFCDLVGSTQLAAQLDPEDLRSTIRAYHARCSEVVARHGGEVAQFLGDGVMVQFGYPRAYEDDAERAVRCALDLVAAVRNLVFADGLRLQTRAGIATGTEVVGDFAEATRDRMSVVGTTPSLASRLQSVAEPETVVITTATRLLIGDAFSITALTSRRIKGVGDDVPLWRIDGERRGASRFAQHHAITSVRFVGRESEIALMRDRWRLAVLGEGCAVLLVAEAGVGKSRIVEEFLAQTSAEGDPITIRLQCAPHYAASALQPLRDFVEGVAGIEPGETLARQFEKVVALDARSPEPNRETVDALTLLLGFDAELSPNVQALTVEQRKAFIFRTLLQYVADVARRSSLRVVVEDMHWVDPTTLELLTALIDTVGDARVFVVATARPEFESPWTRYGHVTTLTLNRLARRAAEAMVSDIGAGANLAPPSRSPSSQDRRRTSTRRPHRATRVRRG